MSLPPFEALAGCLASANPSSFYLQNGDPDFADACDLVLRINGASLPVHTAILAARASAFSPMLAIDHGARQLPDNPFGMDSLPAALLFLRLCYRPEDAPWLQQVPGMIEYVPALIPVLHRVGAISLLGGLERGEDLPDTCSKPVLLGLLDASSRLPGLDGLAAESAARFFNQACDIYAEHHLHTPETAGALGFASVPWADLPLGQLCPQASQLLLRGALTLLADARGRQWQQAVLRETAGVQGDPPVLAKEVSREDMEMALLTTVGGSFRFEVVHHAELSDEPIVFSPVSLGGREWTVRLVPCLRIRPDELAAVMGPLSLEEVEAQPGLGEWMSVYVETDASTLPPAGLKVHGRVTLEHYRNTMYVAQRCETTLLTPASPVLPFHPLADGTHVLAGCYDHHEGRYQITIALDLGISA